MFLFFYQSVTDVANVATAKKKINTAGESYTNKNIDCSVDECTLKYCFSVLYINSWDLGFSSMKQK